MHYNIVQRWNDNLQELLRRTGDVSRLNLGPPMAARFLAIVGTAAYEGWRAFDDNAKTTLSTLTPIGTDPAHRQLKAKEEAISYAIYRVLADLVPSVKAVPGQAPVDLFMTVVDPFFRGLGYDPAETGTNPAHPSGIGNAVAAALIAERRDDGANQHGDNPCNTTPSNDGDPNYYADWGTIPGGAVCPPGTATKYAPQNSPIFVDVPTSRAQITHPACWQQLTYYNLASGQLKTPGYIGPHWGRVRPFALSDRSQPAHGPVTDFKSQTYVDQARHVAMIQERLDAFSAGIAEYWADGPKSSLPPGHWFDNAIWVSQRDRMSIDDTIKLVFALSNAVFDASIAVWEAKRTWNSVRPITAIRYLFADALIPGWKGPDNGFGLVRGSTWRPYQKNTFPTPPFPEYVSGHSGFSAAAAAVLRSFTGSDNFKRNDIFTPFISFVPNEQPAPVTLSWATFTEAAQQAGDSRLFGGIHFYEGNAEGLAMGDKVGVQAFNKAKLLWSGD